MLKHVHFEKSMSNENEKYVNHERNITKAIEKYDINVISLIYVKKDRAKMVDFVPQIEKKKKKVIVMHIVWFQSSPWCK